MNRVKTLQIIDSHTGGEPTRMVLDGFPDLGHGSMAERRALFQEKYDAWRRGIILEPRGSDVIVGALLQAPVNPAHTAGVIYFNNTGYLNMCEHGTIGVIASLYYLGKIAPGEHILETPVGEVTCHLHEDGSVSLDNVPSYRYLHDVPLNVPGLGELLGDVAWGGNWFFLVKNYPKAIVRTAMATLTTDSLNIRAQLTAQCITGKDGAEIDHIELFGESEQADSRSFVMCPGGAYDRSPCGTRTSAKIACLAADNKLQVGEIWRQESIIGSLFTANYRNSDIEGMIIPTIRGRAWVCAESKLILDASDSFMWGIA